MNNLPTPQLGTNASDRIVATLRATVGAAPIVGPALVELITEIVPNQRADRFERFLLNLAERLQKLEDTSLSNKLANPDNIALFEEGAAQAVRALSEERISYISQLVAHGISGDQKARIETKRLLDLLEEVDDDQIIILTSYLRRHSHDDGFQKRHADILESVSAHFGSSQEELNANTMYELARAQLTRLGLLNLKFQKPRKGELPEFDERTGMLKASSRDLTPLGRLLLVRIGLAEPNEF